MKNAQKSWKQIPQTEPTSKSSNANQGSLQAQQERHDKTIKRLMEKGDKRSKGLQNECIMKCNELDKAQNDIRQMMIDASHRHIEMEDQMDRLGRRESSNERQYQREMALKDAKAAEEGKTYRERVFCLEDALQQAPEGEQSKSKFDWQSDAEIAAHVNALAHRLSADKLRIMRGDYEETTRDASTHWSREIAERDEALSIKDVTSDNERSSFSQQRLDIAKENPCWKAR